MKRGRPTMLRLFGPLLMAALGGGCSHAERIAFRNGGVDAQGSPDELLRVALVDGTAYGLTVSGRLRAWKLDADEARTLARAHVHQLAADGSVAVSVTETGASGTTLEVWEPATGRRIAERAFEFGASVEDASRSVILLEVGNPPPSPSESAQQMLPERSHAAHWDLTRDQLVNHERLPVTYRGRAADLSADGTRLLCNSGEAGPMLRDLVDGREMWPPTLAPEWEPPARLDGAAPDGDDDDDGAQARGGRRCPKCSLPYPRPRINGISALFAPDGATVYLTYNGLRQHAEWRLERWTPGADSSDRGRLERLATVPRNISDQVLAVSHAGTMAVTGGRRNPVTVRRAPGFAAETLPLASANTAVFSLDDRRLVTGHEDGRFVAWDTATLRQLAATR